MKIYYRFSIIVILVVVLSNTFFVSAQDWPQWRGPNRDGISAEKNLLKEWPKEGPKLVWQVKDLGSGYATPSVDNKQIYVMANDGLEDEFVKALDVKTGKLVWSTRIGKVGNPTQRPNFPAARSTPTVDGNFLYVLSSDGDLACIDKKSGKISWQKNIRNQFGGKPGDWAYSESPLIDGDKLFCTPCGSEATVVALNKKTGELIWKSAVPGGVEAGYSSIVSVKVEGEKQYIMFLPIGLVGINAETGKFSWLYDKTKGMGGFATPVTKNEFVYSSSRAGCGLVKLVAAQDSIKAEQVYKESNLPSAIGGSVLVGDYLYGTNAKALVCVEFKTGQVKWTEPSIAPGSVCYADGLLYFHGENGDVALVEANSESYKEVGRFTPPYQAEHKRMEKAWPYPVIANGRLYIRDLGSLWSYAIK